MMAAKIVASFLVYVAIVYSKERTDGIDNNIRQKKPNILFIMADDLGWGNVAWANHNTENNEINTPHMDKLVANGLLLNRHYVDMGCSPTRASFQTGRVPIHVTTNNGDGLEDPSHGIPVQMSTIASKLKDGGYGTHLVGKWDCGFSTYSKIPINKGYDTFYGYLSKSVTYFSKLADNDCLGVPFVDLWENDTPAYPSMDDIDNDLYIEFSFMHRVRELITEYGASDSNDPFFIMYSMHLVHYPNEIPAQYLESFDNDETMCRADNDDIYPGFTDGDLFRCRSILQSQVNLMDHIIGRVIETLKANHLYENTLIVFSSDNGGSLEFDNTAGNNYPLRGGKGSFWEGGIRAASFVSGGYLPESRRGQIETGLMHIADWYATFCALAGVDANDRVAIKAGLPNVDGYNMWPLLSGESADSPRVDVIISPFTLIYGNYKLITEKQRFSVWGEPQFPNSDTPSEEELREITAGCEDEGCLFDVVSDPSEYNELSKTQPGIKEMLGQRMAEYVGTVYKDTDSIGTNSCPDSLDTNVLYCGCWMAEHNYNFFVGPYQDLTEDQIHFVDNAYGVKREQEENSALWIGTMRQSYYYAYLSVFSLIFIVIIGLLKCCSCGDNKQMSHAVNESQGSSYGATL